jgi:hypothetical protein
MRYNVEQTTKKYIDVLNKVKEEINKYDYHTIHPLIESYKITRYWVMFLKQKNVTYYQDGFVKWNEKIPVSIKLIDEFRKFQTEINKANTIRRKQTQTPQEMKSIQIPLEIKRRRRTPAVVIEQTPQPQVGLIRKFLRWLY